MVDHTQITRWIEANSSKLTLRVTQEHWIDHWAPRLSAFTATISISGQHFRGHGIDASPDIGLTKAVVEAIERAVAHRCGLKNSSGVAGHLTGEFADRAAIFELVERDAFFCHYLTSSPFESLSASDALTAGGFDQEHILRTCRQHGVELCFGRLVSPAGTSILICLGFGERCERSFGVIVGLGCGQSVEEASSKATLECLSNVAATLAGLAPTSLSVSEFQGILDYQIIDHLRVGLHLDSGPVMKRMLKDTASAAVPLDLSDVSILALEIPAQLRGVPLEFRLASSPRAQNAFFGKLIPECLNVGRLNQFLGSNRTLDYLQRYPHMVP